MKQMKDLKRFSKEWWNNYWFYYKWHTIAGVVVLALIIGTIVDVVTRINPDINIMIASQYVFSEEQLSEMEVKISNAIDDINNDNLKTVQISSLNASIEPKDEMQMAARDKLYLEFAAGDSYIFFMDKALFDFYEREDMFQELIKEQNYIYANELFDFMNEDMVMCVRMQRSNEKEADFANTKKVIDAVLSGNLR